MTPPVRTDTVGRMATDSVPYGTPDAPRIAVRGEAHLEVDPEIARIGVTVAARGKDRRPALDDLTRRNASVLDLLKSYGDAVEHLETGSFSVTPELKEHGRGERVHAYHGRVHITAELTDFTALGELTTRLADLELTRVDGPWWALRPNSPAYREARQQAVREAVQRAREYAEALGTSLAALVELASESDVFLCEADIDRHRGGEQVHLTPEDAGDIARKAGVRELLVTHVGPTLTREAATTRAAVAFAGRTSTAFEGATRLV